MKKYVIVLMLLMAFLFSIGSSAQAQGTTPSANELWDKMKNANPGLQDYSVDLKLNVAVKYHILSPKLNLEGTYYYKKPGKHKLKLKRASYLLNKYPNIFGYNYPDLSRFNSSVRTDNLNGCAVYVVTLTPNYTGTDLKKEEFWIDQKNFSTPRHVYEYKGNGRIVLDIQYRKEKNFLVYDHLDASFNFPKESLTAKASADYLTYNFNIGLTDEFFDKKD